MSLANKTPKGMSLANNLEIDPTPYKICQGYMIGLRYNKMKGNKMKIYGIMQDYEGYLDGFYQKKDHAEKYLYNYIKISGKDKSEFRILEIEVR